MSRFFRLCVCRSRSNPSLRWLRNNSSLRRGHANLLCLFPILYGGTSAERENWPIVRCSI